MKKYISLSIIFLFLLFQLVKAQNDSLKTQALAFVPQYLINNGVRLDYDLKIKNNHWIQFCPQIYLTETSSNSSYSTKKYNEVAGAGLQLYHKIFLNEDYAKFGTYFSYGIAYNFFRVDFDETIENATTKEYTQINKFGGDIIIGYQTIFLQKIEFDVYTGLGTRYSQYKYSEISKPKFNDTYWDYGYTGNLLHFGFRIGVYF